jgi:hypothetical protein
MNKQLDFLLFLGSTYTYLAVNRADEMAAVHGVTLRWHPFGVRSIMIEQNNRPFVGKPVKLAYMWRDVERRAGQYGIPFKSIPGTIRTTRTNWPTVWQRLRRSKAGARCLPRPRMRNGSWKTRIRASQSICRTSCENLVAILTR